MFPVLIKIGPVSIHTYGFMMALGVASALWFVFRQAKKYDLPASRLIDMGFYTIIIALIGAKLILFVGNFSYYTRYPKELFSLARSGGVFQGGLAFGIVFALWYLRKHKLPVWKTADLVGPALALGHGFGRIGCFAAGCCYGRACAQPWGISFLNEYSHDLTGIPQSTPLHPTQLYEAVLNFLNFGILFLVLRRKKFDGQVFPFYIINYSIIRFIVEFYRGDHPDKAYLIKNSSPYLSLSYPQVFCLIGLVGGLLLFFFLKKRSRA
ncbi:MAG: prolipoprotein diacylglyceryl transferase [Candidatus Aminicenantes bacterium]|nr:prolipoprotein diacylglyceryl transferase [Candidatus Aminicenantes bacterium]